MKKSFDFWIFITSLILLGIGTVMVFSASAPYAYIYNDDANYFIKKQIIMIIIGLPVMYITSKIDYRKLGKMSPIIFGITILLLIAVIVLGKNINGATRWLGVGSISFQPSELAKIAIILFLSHYIAVNRNKMHTFKKGVLPCLISLGIVAILLMQQPHLSATVIIAVVVFAIMLCGGMKLSYIVGLGAAGVAGLVGMILVSPYRLVRIMSFLNPFADASGDGWQIVNSLYAIGSGGLFGRGLGYSVEKYLYIPEPHNDFIFSIFAEELGFVGVFFVILLFCFLIFRGYRVAMTAQDLQGTLIAIGITTMIAIQFILNLGVISSIFPPTGIPLPFFSYGGTSLIFLMASVGILLNVSRYSKHERKKV